jgi:hypothetical protein
MNVVYKRVLQAGGDVTEDPELSRYAATRDAANLSWEMERPQSVDCYAEDVTHTPMRSGLPPPV